MTKSLITGGAGFIGSHISDLLIQKGQKVIIVDNLSTGKKANINPQSQFYKMDICDPKISEIFEKERPDFVFHLAAQIDVRKSVRNPIMDAHINVIGSLNILENALRCGAKKIIFASTGGAIYGDTNSIPTTEEHSEQPLSPYGVHKLSVEKSLYFYKKVKGLDYTILRLSNVYGPRQNSKGEAGVIGIFIDKMLKGEEPAIHGHGKQTRDYVYIKDAARAFVLAQEKQTESDKFNIGTGIETSVNEIFNKIAGHLETGTAEKHVAAKPGEQQRSCLSHEKANKELGWSPRYDINQGIKETIEWFKLKNSF